MKKFRLLTINSLLLICLAVSLVACAQKTINDANAVTRSVGSFHAIEVSGGIDLYLSQSNTEAVAVSASKAEYRDRIETVVEDGVLKIYFKNKNERLNWNWSGGKKLKAYVSCKNIDRLHGSGGSDIYLTNTLNVPNLQIHISGGSDLKGAVETGGLDVEQSGGADMHISGKANNLKIEASGGSDFHGYDLTAETCSATCSGGSDIYVTVNKEVNAHASGGSDVHYKGNGVLHESHSSGGSSVSKSR